MQQKRDLNTYFSLDNNHSVDSQSGQSNVQNSKNRWNRKQLLLFQQKAYGWLASQVSFQQNLWYFEMEKPRKILFSWKNGEAVTALCRQMHQETFTSLCADMQGTQTTFWSTEHFKGFEINRLPGQHVRRKGPVSQLNVDYKDKSKIQILFFEVGSVLIWSPPSFIAIDWFDSDVSSTKNFLGIRSDQFVTSKKSLQMLTDHLNWEFLKGVFS